MCDIIDDNGAVGISVVHRGQRLVSLLSCSIPYLKFYCRGIVKGYGLSEEGGADGRFSIVIELILKRCQSLKIDSTASSTSDY